MSHHCDFTSDRVLIKHGGYDTITMNMGTAPDIVSRENCVKQNNAIRCCGLDTTKHGVIELALIGDTVRITTCDAAVNSLSLSTKPVAILYCF
jgi:hypothetical protein